MLFAIRTDDQGLKSFSIIELQGDIQSKDDSPLDNQFVGDLHYSKTGVPMLILGHHLLVGKEVTIEKPMVLLKGQSIDGNKIDYMVQSIIKKKIIFKTRPKPIIVPDD